MNISESPYEGAETVSSMMGLRSRPLGKRPSGGNRFTLGGGVVTGGRLLFWGHDFLQDFFLRKGLIGEKSEYWDSDLNESTSLWWKFSTTSNQTVDLYHKRN